MRGALLALGVVLLIVAPVASSTDWCSQHGVVRVGADGDWVAYVPVDYLFDCWWTYVCVGAWVYAESNGVADLQRGGASIIGDEDYCVDSLTPDMAVF